MARTHGYRVFVVRAFETKVKDNTPLNVEWGSPTAAEILSLLEEAHATGTRYFEPRPPSDPLAPTKPTASLSVEAPAVIKDGLVHVGVSAGEIGSHRKATRPGKKPKSLKKRAPEADHFILLLFSAAPDDRFLLVTQTVRRRDPVARLFAHLQKISMDRRESNRARQKEERKRLRKERKEVPEEKKFSRLVFDRRQAADDLYLDDIVSRADTAAAVFTGYAPSSRGKPEQVERTLRVNILLQNQRDEATGVGKRWVRLLRKDDAVSRSESVAQLGAVLSDDLLSEEDYAGFDRATLSVKSTTGETTNIASDNLREVFTYPVSDGAPGVHFFYDRVSERISKIAAQEGFEAPALDATEVTECLDDST